MAKSWASTLKLPKSTFPPRPLADARPLYLHKATDELYRWQALHRPVSPEQPVFVVHDGPPYANGQLHVGHALNKILKDMTLRVKVQQGRRVAYRPGWDCHGLPIELKALAAADAAETQTPVGIRRVARSLAERTVHAQMNEFRSFGVMADWDARWTTMDATFELRQLRLFQRLVEKGLIERRYKPVYWSPSSQTALAEAELEYADHHVSTAAYVALPVHSLPGVLSELPGLSLVIWTTTPWTLPANEAIAVHRDMHYAVVRLGGDALVVAESCLASFATAVGDEFQVLQRGIPGSDLVGLAYTNPLRGHKATPQPVIHADFVTAGSGTGLVHIAPGHGFDDYTVCQALGLPVPAPVDGAGRFTADAYPDDPARLEGLHVQTEGGPAVLALLGEVSVSGTRVLATQKYRHKYPYDWRTKKPIIVRATAQWFADVARIKAQALASLDSVRFVPATGRSRLESFVGGRSEWCISRQRAWGVPIPALHGDDGSVVLTPATVDHVISVARARGLDAWWSDAPDDAAWVPAALQAAHPGVAYTRGTDTMDVWFDSGSSWTQTLPGTADEQGQADVYLEGSDQHRGWFQSSLLTRVAGLGGGDTPPASLAPFKTLVTHGFLLDGAGKKMSKSLGNIVTGAQVMDGSLLPPIKRKRRRDAAQAVQPQTSTFDALGPDALRLWAASSDYTGDVVVSTSVLQAAHTALTKYRVIFKMLLGSMQPAASVAPADVSTLDRIVLLQLRDVLRDVGAAYDRFEFYRGVAALNRWVANDLSAAYLEAAKDRLYCANGRGAGVLEPLFLGLARMLAPVVPLLVAEAWDHAPAWLVDAHAHPLHQLYADPIVTNPALQATDDQDTALRQALPVLADAHAAVKAALEHARNDKAVGSSLQSAVVLVADGAALDILTTYAGDLDTMFVVSSVDVQAAGFVAADRPAWVYEATVGSVTATVTPPRKEKCQRCWRYVAESPEDICTRCADVVQESTM